MTTSTLVIPEDSEDGEGAVAYEEMRCRHCEVGWTFSKSYQVAECWFCGAPGERGSVRRLLVLSTWLGGL